MVPVLLFYVDIYGIKQPTNIWYAIKQRNLKWYQYCYSTWMALALNNPLMFDMPSHKINQNRDY